MTTDHRNDEALSNPEKHVTLVFGKGHTINENLAQSLVEQVATRIMILTHRVYTLRQICGEDYWKKLSSGEKIAAGQYISHLERDGSFPLVEVKWEHEYPKKYRKR